MRQARLIAKSGSGRPSPRAYAVAFIFGLSLTAVPWVYSCVATGVTGHTCTNPNMSNTACTTNTNLSVT
jgi:hypothetical protein